MVYQKLALLAQDKFGQAQLDHRGWGTMGAAECVECGRRSGRGKTRDAERTLGALNRPRHFCRGYLIFDN